MRNLKRVLSLALAATMLMGMMVMGASAAEDNGYSDASKITKNEAVDVMSSIGVFQGNNNEFNPTGDLTREQAAKIITYMLMGKKAADDLKSSAAPFKDVAADRWSAGSIAYCAANGIVAGDGQGSFYPEVKVTGHQFGKMLLTALGYKAETEGYVGSGWELNVAKQIQALKLASNVGVGMSNVLNREQAAQMAFNTLESALVEYVGGTNVKLPDGTTVVSGGTRQTVKASDGVTVLAFMDNYFPNLDSTNFVGEAFGRPAHQWKNGATKIGVYSNSATVTYTEATKKSVIESDLSGYAFPAGLVADLNGDAQVGATDVDTAAKLAAVTGAGRLVEVYTGKVLGAYTITNVVIVDFYLAKINTINTASKVVTLSVDTASGGGSLSLKKDDNETLYNTLAALSKDDYVVITKIGTTVKSAYEPETINGTLKSITKDGEYVIDGVTYTLTKGKNPGATPGTAYTAYLDKYDNIIGAVAETAASTKNALVLDVEQSGSLASNTYVVSAKLLLTDGTMEWVKVASHTNPAGTTTLGIKDTGFYAAVNANKNKFVSYSIKSDGSYALNELAMGGTLTDTIVQDTANKGYTLGAGTITKSTVNFFDDGTTFDMMGTGKTVFLVNTTTAPAAPVYKAYTGINAIGNYTITSGKVLIAKDSTTALVVVIDTSTATAKDLVYILSNTPAHEYDTDLGKTVYVYDAIVNGVVKTITTTVTVDNTTPTAGALDLGAYTVESYSGDYASSLKKVTSQPAKTNNFIRVADPTGIALNVASGTITIPGATVINNVLADEVAVVGVDSNKNTVELTVSDIEFYATNGNKITDVVATFNSDGFITGIIFQYVLA